MVKLGLSPGSKSKSQLAHHYHVVQLKRVLAARRWSSEPAVVTVSYRVKVTASSLFAQKPFDD